MRPSSQASFRIPWAVFGPDTTPLATFAVAIIFNWWGNYCISLHRLHMKNLKDLFIPSIPSHIPFTSLLAMIILLHSKLKRKTLGEANKLPSTK